MRKIAIAVMLGILAMASGCALSDFIGIKVPPADNLFGWVGNLL